MKELSQLCLKANKKELLKEKSIKKKIQEMKTLLEPFKINCVCKSDLDYFKLCIVYNGVLNKIRFEEVYEDVHYELAEVWDIIEFNKKNEFLQKAFEEKGKDCIHFFMNEAKIYMPFFDELMNAFYTKQLAIFELPQFFKLYKDFSERMINLIEYKEYPYKHGFVDVQYLYGNHQGFGIYVKENHSIYVISFDEEITRIPLSTTNLCEKVDSERSVLLIESVLNHDVMASVQWCINCGQINEKIKKKCISYLQKLKEEKK